MALGMGKNFISYINPQEYDFREEIIEFTPDMDETARFGIYQAIGIAEQDMKSRHPEENLAYKEAGEIYKKQHILLLHREADNCPLIKELCQLLYEEKFLSHCTGKNGIIIDTMNSCSTTFNRLMNRCQHQRWSKRKSINLYYHDENRLRGIFRETKNACSFMKQSYVIGNFIPVPFNRPLSSVCDYWDLTMYYIYLWYQKRDDGYLSKIVGKSPGNVERYKRWLDSFQDEYGTAGWDTFIERNYLQDFASVRGEKYGEPAEFWDNHFSGKVMPADIEEVETFCDRAGRMTAERSSRIVRAIKKKSA